VGEIQGSQINPQVQSRYTVEMTSVEGQKYTMHIFANNEKHEIGVSCPSPPKGTLRIGSIKRNVFKSVCSTRFKDILVILFVKTDTVKLRFPH
ncbi:hypothetical protein ACQVTQ_30125, partial [Bacillus mycoides]